MNDVVSKQGTQIIVIIKSKFKPIHDNNPICNVRPMRNFNANVEYPIPHLNYAPKTHKFEFNIHSHLLASIRRTTK